MGEAARVLSVVSDEPRARRSSGLVGGTERMSDEMLLCRDLRHAWSFKTDEGFVRNRRGKLVRITRVSRCERGCGCTRTEEIEVPSFERVGKPQIHYPEGYQIRGGGLDVTDYRREYYARLGHLT